MGPGAEICGINKLKVYQHCNIPQSNHNGAFRSSWNEINEFTKILTGILVLGIVSNLKQNQIKKQPNDTSAQTFFSRSSLYFNHR